MQRLIFSPILTVNRRYLNTNVASYPVNTRFGSINTPMLVPEREEAYRKLSDKIGNTPLVRYRGHVPNGNTIWIKRECDNPFGIHYDRVYLALFKYYETLGRIKPGDKILETSSGSAGVSFAAIGTELGYHCTVMLPAGGEKARERAISDAGGEIIYTDATKYIAGFIDTVRPFLSRNKNFFFLNHSMGGKNTVNPITLAALSNIGREISRDVTVDYFIPAVRNGSSVLGTAQGLGTETRIIAVEPFQSAVAYDLKYPGRYRDLYGIPPGSLPRHRLPGMSYQGIRFPHIQESIPLLQDIILVSDKATDTQYWQYTGRTDTQTLPHWDDSTLFTADDYGRSTNSVIAAALTLAKTMHGKNLVVIAYDKANRYDAESAQDR